MNKSFFIIFIPAVFVAAMYVSLGIYPPLRVLIGVAIVTVGLAVWGIRMWMKRSRTAARDARTEPPPAAPAPPAAPTSPTAS